MKVPPKSRTESESHRQHDHVLVGDGETAQIIRAFDWPSVGLPEIKDWSPTLLSTINLLLQSPVAIVTLWGPDGILIYNDAYSLFAGTRHPEIFGSKVLEGWPEVEDFNANVMAKVYHGGSTLSYKDQELILYRNSTPDTLWTDLNYSPIFDTDGSIIGVFCAVTETTDSVIAQRDLRNAEAALRAEQERLQSLFLQAPAMIAVLHGPDHVFELANPLYQKIAAPNRDIVGKPVIEAIPELAGQGVIEILDDVLLTGKAYKGILEVALDTTGDGELQQGYFNLVYQPISSRSDGKPDGIFVHAIDVSEQIHSQRDLERANAELEAIFESLPDGVYTLDRTSVNRMNQRGAEILGYASPEDAPKNIEDLFNDLRIRFGGDSTEPDTENNILARAFRGELATDPDVRMIDPNTGRERYVRSAAAPMTDANGTVIGAVATVSDLTEQYHMQAAMQKELVRRRVLSQKTKLLKDQNDQLTLLNKTKDEFIALTSHQLRTPATGVKQYLGLVTEGFAGDISDEQREFLTRAYESNDRQLQIIDDILRVARIDLDQIKIVKKEQNLTELLQSIIAEQLDTFESRNQHIMSQVDNPKLEAAIDAHYLGMAIGNIVDNASKYTHNGKRITIGLVQKDDTAVITVKDEGVGIDKADLDKLFQKFSRVHNERSIEVGGTGLGLYLSQKLIEKHGGSVTVDSERNIGTTFTITIPL